MMVEEFVRMIGLTGGIEQLDEALEDIDALVFDEVPPKKECVASAWDVQLHDILNCINLSMEARDEDPRNIMIED